jgi:hypothetical protein
MADYPAQTLEVGQFFVEEVMDIFEACGCPDDFCVQNAGGYVLVFGGTNRLCWSAKKGFYPDRSYCTKRFLASWDKSYGSTP